jgi:hypothetical protein
LVFGIACPSGQYSVCQQYRDDGSGEGIMTNGPEIDGDSAVRTAAFEGRGEEWSKGIKQACDFFVTRALWVWLILTIGLIAGVLSTT